MQNNSDLVSVVMSAYNSESSIAESIESILNQSYQNIEFLIIDDCSTDRTADVIESYLEKNKNIKFVSGPVIFKSSVSWLDFINFTPNDASAILLTSSASLPKSVK